MLSHSHPGHGCVGRFWHDKADDSYDDRNLIPLILWGYRDDYYDYDVGT